MNKTQEQIIMGSLLGDGCIYKQQKLFCYSEAHTIKQKDYLLWKNKFLKYNFNEYKRKDGLIYVSINKTNEEIKQIYQLFYQNGRKQINKKILKKVNPLGLAVWYLDDGYYNYRTKWIDLYTCCFNLKEHALIKKWLKKRFDIECKIKTKRKKYYYLSLNGVESKKLISLIKKHIIPSMEYKIGLDRGKEKHAKEMEKKYRKSKKRIEYKKGWRERNREKINEQARKRYWKNIEKERCRNKKYREKNREKLNKYARDYYYLNKEAILKKKKED